MPAGRPASQPPADVIARLRAGGCVFAEDEALMLVRAAVSADDLDAMIGQRVAGLPLEQVLGWAEFCGQRVGVDAGVFVPRRRTEFLVSQAIAVTKPGAVVLDMCCGSGAIGAALAAVLRPAELHAVDVEPAAVACARRNLAGVGGQVYEGDLYDPLPAALRGRVGLLVANGPYVPSGELSMLPAEARLHEPAVALDGGTDGLDVLRRIASQASLWLAPRGHLLFETSPGQAREAARFVARSALAPRIARSRELNAAVLICELAAESH